MRKKLIVGLSGILGCLFLMGCGASKEFSKENFGLTTNEQENNGEYVIAINIDKDMVSVDYELSENGSVKETGEYKENNKGLLKECKVSEKSPGEYDYVLTVKDSDGNTLNKELKITVLGEDEDKDSTEDNDKDDETKDSNGSDSDKKDSEDKEEDKESDTNTVSSGDWSGDSKAYKVGDKVTYNGKSYECIQAHTSQEDWTPSATASLWKEKK